MTSRQRIISILIGVAGSVISVLALAGFLLKMLRNGLVLPEAHTTQAYYTSVGAAYADGYVAGFALCFFLTLLAVALGTWFEARRDRSSRTAGSRAAEVS